MDTGLMFSSQKDYWETPQSLFDELNAEFHFTLDAAASDTNHKCDRYFTEQDDGLRQSWAGETVFCNPPYGRKETGEWTKKMLRGSEKSRHNGGTPHTRAYRSRELPRLRSGKGRNTIHPRTTQIRAERNRAQYGTVPKHDLHMEVR